MSSLKFKSKILILFNTFEYLGNAFHWLFEAKYKSSKSKPHNGLSLSYPLI